MYPGIGPPKENSSGPARSWLAAAIVITKDNKAKPTVREACFIIE
jgi:hypothetical protein